MMFGKSDQSIRWHFIADHVAVHEKSPRDTTTWTLRSDTDESQEQQKFSKIVRDPNNLLVEV